VKPTRSDAQPGAVEAEVDVNAGSDANKNEHILPLFRGPLIY
jgi:hypothetical protein